MYPSKQISPPFNLSFFCRLNSHDIFFPIFFFFYSQENVFALPPPQCLFHSHSCHRDLYKVLTPLQAQNLSCCRSKLLHTPVWDTVLHKSLNKSVWGGFFPQKLTCFTNFLPFFYAGPGRPKRRYYTQMLPEGLRTQCKHKEMRTGDF